MNQYQLLLSVSAAAIAAVLFYIAGNTAVKEQDQQSLKLFLLMFTGLWTVVILRQHLFYDTLIVPSTAGLLTGIGSAIFADKNQDSENGDKSTDDSSDNSNGSDSSN